MSMSSFMGHVMAIVFFAGFFALIGFAVYWTRSAHPMWALLLLGFIKVSIGDGDCKPSEPQKHIEQDQRS